MEAIYLWSKSLISPPQPTDILSRRTNTTPSGKELWFRYKLDNKIFIIAEIDGVKIQFWLSFEESKNRGVLLLHYIYPSQDKLKQLSNTVYSGLDFSLNISTGQLIDQIPVSQELKEKITRYAGNISLIDCTLKSQTTEIERKLAKLKIEGKDDKFGDVLDDIY